MDFVILDRDGVINFDSDDFIKSPEEWEPIPGSLDAIARLNRAGFRVVVATNQSGIARGLLDIEVLNRIHDKMRLQLAELGGNIDAIFFCACLPDDGCECYKPRPGMLLDIASRLRTSLDGVPAIGDAKRDIDAALAVGARPMLVLTGKGRRTFEQLGREAAIEVFDDLAGAVDALLESRLGD